VVHLFLYRQNEREQDGREQLRLVFQAQQLQHREAGFTIERRGVGVEVFSVRSPGAVGIEQHGQLSKARDDGRLVCGRLIHILIGQVIMNVVDTGFVCLLLPRIHYRFLQDRFTDAIQRLRRTGEYRQQAHNPFRRMINVLNVGERVKAQFRAIEINPAGLVTVVLVAVPHVDNPGVPPAFSTSRRMPCVRKDLPAPDVPVTAMLKLVLPFSSPNMS
jgi:hypothetical protein